MNYKQWVGQLQQNMITLTAPIYRGEEHLWSVVTCDGHAEHKISLDGLDDLVRSIAELTLGFNQEDGIGTQVQQELIKIYGLVANAKLVMKDNYKRNYSELKGQDNGYYKAG